MVVRERRVRMRTAARDPYRDDIRRRLAARAPLGFGVFLFCVAVSTVFEVLRFPERRPWMLGFAAGFVALAAIASAAIRRHPDRAGVILIATVNLIGVALNVYHVLVAGSVAMCMWTLTGLLAVSA